MYGELTDGGQGGSEYELYQDEKLKEQWLDECPDMSFEDWLDLDTDPEEEEDYED